MNKTIKLPTGDYCEIYIEVDGGVVQAVHCDKRNAKVIMLDWDDYKAEDELGRIAMDDLFTDMKEKLEKGEIKQIY